MFPLFMLPTKLLMKAQAVVLVILLTVGAGLLAFNWHQGKIAQVVQETRNVVTEETKSADKQNASAIRDRVTAGIATQRLQPKATGSDTRGYRD